MSRLDGKALFLKSLQCLASPSNFKACIMDVQAGQLSEDDYFSRNPEFSTWLVAEKGRHFNQLTAEESRELFAKFVSRWNSKKLPAKYYAGLAAPASMRRTGHDWGLRGTIN